MSIYGPWVTQLIDISESTTISEEFDIKNNYEYIQVIYPAMTACTMSIYVSDTTAGTFVPLANSANATVGAAASADTYCLGGYRYFKLVSSGAQAADRSIKVRGLRA